LNVLNETLDHIKPQKSLSSIKIPNNGSSIKIPNKALLGKNNG